MPIYEYGCHKCKESFTMVRPVAESKEDAICPKCNGEAKRLLSQFSNYSASAPDNAFVVKDKMEGKKWDKMRYAEDWDKKNPDPLKRWRDERQEACGKGPEAWVEYANEEKAKEKKKETYGDNWLGREL